MNNNNNNNIDNNNAIKDKSRPLVDKIKNILSNAIVPSYAFKVFATSMVILVGGLVIMQLIEKYTRLNRGCIDMKRLMYLKEEFLHYLSLTEQDTSPIIAYSHLLKSEFYLQQMKELADGKESLMEKTSIDFDEYSKNIILKKRLLLNTINQTN